MNKQIVLEQIKSNVDAVYRRIVRAKALSEAIVSAIAEDTLIFDYEGTHKKRQYHILTVNSQRHLMVSDSCAIKSLNAATYEGGTLYMSYKCASYKDCCDFLEHFGDPFLSDVKKTMGIIEDLSSFFGSFTLPTPRQGLGEDDVIANIKIVLDAKNKFIKQVRDFCEEIVLTLPLTEVCLWDSGERKYYVTTVQCESAAKKLRHVVVRDVWGERSLNYATIDGGQVRCDDASFERASFRDCYRFVGAVLRR